MLWQGSGDCGASSFHQDEKRILKGNRETASHRKTVLLLAMEHISYNETFDSLSGFKLYLKLKTERLWNWKLCVRHLSKIDILYCEWFWLKESVFDRKLLRIAQNSPRFQDAFFSRCMSIFSRHCSLFPDHALIFSSVFHLCVNPSI